MPCYLFTYHAYRSWMPDRERGYVRRDEGVLPPDEEMADQYRRLAKEDQVWFDAAIQRTAIDESMIAAGFQRFRLHMTATDPTHIHVLVSWTDARQWPKLRNGLKSSLTRRLNRDHHRRTWFVENASRKRVKDVAHFTYHMTDYLPKHRGWKWREDCGCFLESGEKPLIAGGQRPPETSGGR